MDGLEGAGTTSAGVHGRSIPNFGLRGGSDGTPGQTYFDGKPLSREEYLADTGALSLDQHPDLLVSLDSPGGGGFGPPSERDPEAVRADVRDELVSVEKARELYGYSL